MGEWLSTVSYWHLTKCPKQNEFTSLFLNHQAATALTPILTAITRSPISQGPEKFTVTSTFQWAQVSTSFTFSEAGAGVEEGQPVPACLSSMHGTCVYVCVGRGGATEIIRPGTQTHQLPLNILMRHLQTVITETENLENVYSTHAVQTHTHTCTDLINRSYKLVELNGPCIFYIEVINLAAHIQISPFLHSRTTKVTERSSSRGKSREKISNIFDNYKCNHRSVQSVSRINLIRIQKIQLQTIEGRIL